MRKHPFHRTKAKTERRLDEIWNKYRHVDAQVMLDKVGMKQFTAVFNRQSKAHKKSLAKRIRRGK